MVCSHSTKCVSFWHMRAVVSNTEEIEKLASGLTEPNGFNHQRLKVFTVARVIFQLDDEIPCIFVVVVALLFEKKQLELGKFCKKKQKKISNIKRPEDDHFKLLGGCNRCQMINIGSEAGNVNKPNQPLATLASYRRELIEVQIFSFKDSRSCFGKS